MAVLRAVVAEDAVLSVRTDTMVGAEFSLYPYDLGPLVVEQVLAPLVETTGSYRFDPPQVASLCARLEARLRLPGIRFVEFLPVLGFASSLDALMLDRGALMLRPMSDEELSEAVGLQAVSVDRFNGRNAAIVSHHNHWALVGEREYPVVSYKQGMPEQPRADVFPSFVYQAQRLIVALRVACGGTATTTRPIRIQHPDDTLVKFSAAAVLYPHGQVDPARPTVLHADQFEAVSAIYDALALPAVCADRPLQHALRRLVFAGSRPDPTDRVLDLAMCAEALLLKRAVINGPGKGGPIAEQAEALLSGDGELGAAPGTIRSFVASAYRVRNAEMHGDGAENVPMIRLDGTVADKLELVADDFELVMRRALQLSLPRA